MTFSNENNKSAFSEGEKTTFKNEPENTLTYTVSKNVETVVINITEDKLKIIYEIIAIYPLIVA